MLTDQRECACGESFPRLSARPGGRARRMRQRNDIDTQAAARHGLECSDLVHEWPRRQELFDRDPPHRQDQGGLEQLDLAIEPGAAIEQLFRARHAITALGVFSWETPACGRNVDAGSELFLVETERQEPLEELLAGGPSERATERGLFVAWGLPDEKHFGADRVPHDWRAMHVRAETAGAKRALVSFEQGEGGLRRGRLGQRLFAHRPTMTQVVRVDRTGPGFGHGCRSIAAFAKHEPAGMRVRDMSCKWLRASC